MEEESSGLEIVSIGKIYKGAWNKKYWSSSRGKDRFPFPIGYKAVRIHNVITYQMEIQEGSKGPSFLISSSDGHSCSGQTPDMAWEIFQKKGCPRIKLWHGKRFSCKIDGAEFFGFKNAFVQRLLRELGTHTGVAAEPVISGSINEDASKKEINSHAESCAESINLATSTNLKTGQLQVKGKRSRKLKSINPNPTDAASCKKIRPEDKVFNDRVSHERKVHNNGSSDSGHKLKDLSSHAESCFDTMIEVNAKTDLSSHAESCVESMTEFHAKKDLSLHAESCVESINPATSANLIIPQVKGKRSRKPKNIDPIPTDAASCKKFQPRDEVCNKKVSHEDRVHNNKTSDSGHKNYFSSKHGPSLNSSASNEDHVTHDVAKALVMSMDLETVIEEKRNSTQFNDDLPVISCHASDHPSNGEEPPHTEEKLVNYSPTGAIKSVSMFENSLDGSTIAKEKSSLALPEEPKDEEVSVAKDTEGMKNVDLCVPDSLESLHDRTSDSQLDSQKESSCNSKCELVAGIGSVTISETIGSELHHEKETSTSIANSEKSDFDSIGDDIAKSMMSLLLPQALPLLFSKKKSPKPLKTFSRKKRRVLKLPENIIGCEEIQKKNKETEDRDCVPNDGSHVKYPLLRRDEATVVPDSLDVFRSGNEVTAVPDSYIDEETSYDVPQAELAIVDHKLQLPAQSNALEKSSACHPGTSFGDKKCEGKKISTDMCEETIRSDYVRGSQSSTENNLHESIDVTCKNNNDFFCHENLCDGKELKNLLENNKADDNAAGMVGSWEVLQKEFCIETSGLTIDSSLTENVNAATLSRQIKGPFPESIICRSSAEKLVLPAYAISELIPTLDSHPVSSLVPEIVGKIDPVSNHLASGCPLNNKVNLNLIDPSSSCLRTSTTFIGNESPMHSNNIYEENVSMEKPGTSFSSYDLKLVEGPWVKPQMKTGHFDDHEKLHLVGCYVHLSPISLVLLKTIEEEIRICVLCGASADQERKLFMYKLSTKEQMFGSPSFIGHTTLLLPHSRDAFRREISVDRTCLQLTPDGQSLVILNSVKAPCCREKNLQCSCPACNPSFNENAGLRVVQVKKGYVTVLVKLRTSDNVQCVLACEPNYLIGIEESGILHLWVMNSVWSALIEECDLSTSDCIFPCIVELKRIPNHSALILGHNGFGEFGVWDIDKRIFVARFSLPSTSVFQFLPISVFKWQRKDSIFTKPLSQGKEQSTQSTALTRRLLSKQGENQSFDPTQGDEIAIWILISTICGSDTQNEPRSTDHQINKVGLWRLALVVENTVILGSALDHRATAIGASNNYGILGTNDGAVYMWDLSTGTKLCDLHHLQGANVSCIATDDSNLGPIAIAGGDQLLVYVHSQKCLSGATSV